MANEEKYITTRVRLRLLDITLLLLAVLTAVATWQQSNLAYIFEADHTPRSFAVSFEITNVPHTAIDSLTANTVVYTHTDRGMVELGALVDEPTEMPHIMSMAGEAGTPPTNVIMPQNDVYRYVDATGTFLCRGVLREGALVMGDVVLSVGSDVWVTTTEGNFYFHVLSISENR